MQSLRPVLHSIAAALTCMVLLSACGEFAYKRGAGAAELEEARSSCRASAKPGQTYEQCMASLGWTVQNLDEEPLLATTSVNPDNRAAAPSPAGNMAVTPELAKEVPVTPVAVKPVDPMDLLKINSLWKLGGNSAELQSAIDSCVATLGDAYRPTADRQLMTRGLVRCLRDKGWYGVANR